MYSDEWITTFSPETARLAEQAMAAGELAQNFQYAVPRAWHEAHPDHGPVVWMYRPPNMLTGEPFDLRAIRWATDL